MSKKVLKMKQKGIPYLHSKNKRTNLLIINILCSNNLLIYASYILLWDNVYIVYIWMYVCMYVCMQYVCMNILKQYVGMYVCMHVCMFVCLYASMYVCMFICAFYITFWWKLAGHLYYLFAVYLYYYTY